MSQQTAPQQDYFELPEGMASEFTGLGSQTIELPFMAPMLWWLNGDPRAQTASEASKMGGWAISQDEIELLDAPPPGFVGVTLVNARGQEYSASLARYVAVAVIGSREQWVLPDANFGGRTRGYSRIQVLGYMATVNQARQYVPYGPVVLSAKSYSAKYLKEALSEWSRKTAQSRRKLANNLPAWLFYAPIGTFGASRDAVMVGPDPNSQSPITPCRLMKMPDEQTANTLRGWYVGKSVVEEMSEYKQAAGEWLKAWDGMNGNGQASQAEHRSAPPPPPDDVNYATPGGPEELLNGIPF